MARWGRAIISVPLAVTFRLVMAIAAAAVLAGCLQVKPKDAASDPIIIDQQAVGATQRSTRAVIGQPGTYRIKPGDTLSVFVFGYPELTRSITVGPDGRINYPLAGVMRAQGMTLSGIDAALTKRLESNILEPEVAVSLVEVAPRKIFVTGEVIAPGAFDVTEPVSIVQAISMAGGFTVFADRTNVIVYNPARQGGARRIFNFEAFLADPTGLGFALRPGDTVIVQ